MQIFHTKFHTVMREHLLTLIGRMYRLLSLGQTISDDPPVLTARRTHILTYKYNLSIMIIAIV